ncbi:hypothetical protein [Porphyromonas sp.]|uniref:hypothetical protein n=1 Tax=Porphyromonas sp. TaxID=1924944 RepID=UPI003A9006F9
MSIPYQVVFQKDWEEQGQVIRFWREDSEAFQRAGIPIGLTPLPEAEHLIYRSATIYDPKNYPSDARYIHTYDINNFYLMMHRYLPVIEDLSVPTFFVDQLDERVDEEMARRGWREAFIKKDAKSLEAWGEGMSIYPRHSFAEMLTHFDKMPGEKYCIRQVMDKDYIIEHDTRYWVLNGKVYRRDGLPIPEIVLEAADRLIKAKGGRYFTIDATPQFVIEVNPGESSDRHGENSAELFASWFVDAFFTNNTNN